MILQRLIQSPIDSPISGKPSLATNSRESTILNDTSLTALLLSDGSRHTFFQATDGSFRHAVYIASTDSWELDMKHIHGEAQPRNHTPVAASHGSTLFSIILFYVDVADQLAALTVTPRGLHSSPNLLRQSIPVLAGSRSLSVSQVFDNDLAIATHIFYEDPNGKAIALKASHAEGRYRLSGKWQNITDALRVTPRGSEPIASISGPFAVTAMEYCVYYFSKLSSAGSTNAFLQVADLSRLGPSKLSRNLPLHATKLASV